MEIVLTGTGSPLPDANRAGPSTLIKAGDTHILVDAGRGTVMRMAGAGSMPPFLAAVCITHLHSDHVCALNDVITTHWVMTAGNATLDIYGPVGIAEFVERSLAALEPDIGYRIAHHDVLTVGPQVQVIELEPGDTFEISDVVVKTAATAHAPVHPTIGFRFEHAGNSAALVGDTLPCAGVDELCANADVYVQTVIRYDIVQTIPQPMMQDILDYHSDLPQAAETAARNNVDTLMLTHMVPAPTPDQYDDWRAIAAEKFDGTIVIGDDLVSVTV